MWLIDIVFPLIYNMFNLENKKCLSTYLIGPKKVNYNFKDFQTIKLNTQESSEFINEMVLKSKNEEVKNISDGFKYYFEKNNGRCYLYSSKSGSECQSNKKKELKLKKNYN